MAGVLHFMLLCGSFILISAITTDETTTVRSTLDSDASFPTTGSLFPGRKTNTTEVPTTGFISSYSKSTAKPQTSTNTQHVTEDAVKPTEKVSRKATEVEEEGPLELERRSTRSVKVAKKPKTILKKPKLISKKPKKVVKKTKPKVKHSERQTVTSETVPQCPPLGLESLKVKDNQLRASSYQRRGLGPHRGRLNIQSGVEDGDIYDGGWCAQYKDKQQWLEVDARRLTRFTGVILQGRSSIWSWNVVYTYKVQFSNDTLVWKPSMNGTEEALTTAHLAQVSRRIIGVVTELVYQVLVPVLMAELQDRDFSDDLSKKSQKEEDIQSGDSRSSLLVVKPYVEGSVAKSLGGSVSQSSARSMLGGAVRQVEQDLSLLAVPPPEIPAEVIPPWHDVKQRQKPTTGQVKSVMDRCAEVTGADVEAERDSCKILTDLETKMRREYESDLDSLDGERCCSYPVFKITFPLKWFKNTTKPEDGESTASQGLNVNPMELLLSHKEALDKRKEDEERNTVSHLLSSGSEEQAEDSTTGSCESRVSSMRSVVKSFLDETEQMLKEDDSSVQRVDAAVTMLEELISQEELFAFSGLLADKVSSMFKEQFLAVFESVDPSQSQQRACTPGFIALTDQVHVFIEESVNRLLMFIFSPTSSWGMGHTIQVQSNASSHADLADSAEQYEEVIDVFRRLMAIQVIENLSRMSAASRPQQEVSGPEKKENFINFFQELLNNIRKKWRKLMNKDV